MASSVESAGAIKTTVLRLCLQHPAAARGGLASAGYSVRFILQQIGFGVLLGVLGGAAGGFLIERAVRAGWMSPLFRQLGTLALGVAAFASVEWVSGNGFVAGFSAGLVFGQVAREQCPHVADFAEDQGHLLELVTSCCSARSSSGWR